MMEDVFERRTKDMVDSCKLVTKTAHLPTFAVDDDGFPLPGPVVKYYRTQMTYLGTNGEQKHWTQADLAKQLQISVIQVRRMENNNQYLDSMDRRKTLATLLNIPPVLLGLASIGQLRNIMQNNTAAPKNTVNIVTHTKFDNNAEVQLYRDVLPIFKDTFEQYKLDALMLERWIGRMKHFLDHTGNKKDALQLLVQYHVLAGKVYSQDTFNQKRAMYHLNAATRVATLLDDTELKVFSHHHAGELYLVSKDLMLAKNELETALALSKHVNPQVKGRVLTFTALTYAMTRTDGSDAVYAQRLLGEAEKCALSPGDTTLMKFDTLQYLVDKADTQITLGLYAQAQRTLEETESCSDNGIRKNAYLQILQAECYIKQKRPEYEAAAGTLYQVLSENIRVKYYVDYVARLHILLARGSYGKAPDVVELGQMLRGRKVR
ncbi:MAG: helix-turn-helix domain-containing protein [Ktedonobacteraceae bacterium]